MIFASRQTPNIRNWQWKNISGYRVEPATLTPSERQTSQGGAGQGPCVRRESNEVHNKFYYKIYFRVRKRNVSKCGCWKWWERRRTAQLCTLIRNIWHSFHYRNPRLSQDPLALPLCFSLLVFLWHFPLILQCIFCCSSDIQSRISVSKLGQGSLTGVWGTWQVLYGRVGGCSVWLLILLWLTTYTCLRQVSHCRTVDMEICSKFNSKYQVAPGKLFENDGERGVRGVPVGGEGSWVLCVASGTCAVCVYAVC